MKRIVLFLLLLLPGILPAQSVNWTAIMSEGSAQQTYDYFYKISDIETFIREQAKKGKVITELTYGTNDLGSRVWYAVATATPKATDISWQYDTKFPSDWVSKKWDEGQHITKVAYGDGQWYVIMTNNTPWKLQSWATRYSWEDLEKYFKSKWDDNDKWNITDIAYANGMWCAVMSLMDTYEDQKYLVSKDYPNEWIQGKYDKGYNISTIESDGESWFVVMTKYAKQKSETIFNPDSKFPGSKIKEQWDKNRRIASLVFRDASKSKDNLFKTYKDLGDKKLDANDLAAAIDAYDKAIELKTDEEGVWNNRAWAKFLSGYCYTALSDINKAIELKSTYYNNHTKASILKCQGKCAEAITYFNEAVRLYKEAYGKVDNTLYYSDRAEAKKCIGNYNGAREDLVLALAIQPGNTKLKSSLAEIDGIISRNSKPVITWDKPIERTVQTMNASVTLQACIASGAPVKKKTIVLNGTEMTAQNKGLGVESDCSDLVSQDILLRPGENEVYIKVTSSSGDVTYSDKRKFVYQPSSNRSNNYALFVAVEEYNDPAINPLNDPTNRSVGPVAELKRLKKTLVDKYNFPESNIRFLTNPDKSDITNNLAYFNTLKSTDNFLLVYSGHGDTLGKSGFWLPRDAVKANRKNFLSIGELNDYLQNINTRHTLVIADACFSGMLLQQGTKSLTDQAECNISNENTGFTALTSGSLNPVPNSNLFMNTLIGILDGTGSCISAEKLYFLVKQNMLAAAGNIQVPQYGMLRLDQIQLGGHFTFFKR